MRLVNCYNNRNTFISSLETLDFMIDVIKNAGLKINCIKHCNEQGYHIFIEKIDTKVNDTGN